MLAIFNPEHDLCLANGNAHYVPPQSALDFAVRDARVMQRLYPYADCLPSPLADADALGQYLRQHDQERFPIVAWGWNSTLKNALLHAGIEACRLPSDESLSTLRKLQHRTTLLPLQPDCISATTVAEVDAMLRRHHAVVLKAPWSGAGRGLRWATGTMTSHDRQWMEKVVRTQRCVVVEPRRDIDIDYALEYSIADGTLQCLCHSLFKTVNGVYRSNVIRTEAELAQQIAVPQLMREQIEAWLRQQIVPHYSGPLGIDLIRDTSGHHHLCELNLRHTMGMVYSTRTLDLST